MRQTLGEPDNFSGFSKDLPWETAWKYGNVIFIFCDDYHVGLIFANPAESGMEDLCFILGEKDVGFENI